MASDTSDAAAQLVLLYQAADSNLYWTSCALALLSYDYALTFRHEVRFVWGRKFSAATALFLVNRYFFILLYLVDLVTLFPILPEVSPCPGIGRFITVLEVIPYIIWATFSALRAYALSSRTATIGISIFTLSLVPAGVNAYFFSTFSFMNLDAPSNCTALSDITPELSKTLKGRRTVTIVSRAALMAADVLVIAVTWVNTYQLGKASREVRIGASFGTLLLRDGTIYFVVLLAMNVVHMTLNTVKPNNFVQQASYVTVLENPITSILISRFILNLRAVDHRGGDGGASDTLYSTADPSPSFVRTYPGPEGQGRGRRWGAASTVRFASVVSTRLGVVDVLGAPMAHEFDGDDSAVLAVEDGAEDEVRGDANPEKAHVSMDAAAGSREDSGTHPAAQTLGARDPVPAPRITAHAESFAV